MTFPSPTWMKVLTHSHNLFGNQWDGPICVSKMDSTPDQNTKCPYVHRRFVVLGLNFCWTSLYFCRVHPYQRWSQIRWVWNYSSYLGLCPAVADLFRERVFFKKKNLLDRSRSPIRPDRTDPVRSVPVYWPALSVAYAFQGVKWSRNVKSPLFQIWQNISAISFRSCNFWNVSVPFYFSDNKSALFEDVGRQFWNWKPQC
jgi:hypothetical protein